LKFKFNYKIFKEGFNFAIKTYFSNFICAVILRGNIVILQHLVPLQELGYYSVALQIIDSLTMVAALYSLLLFPEIVSNPNEGWVKTKKAMFSFGYPFLAIHLVVLLFAKPLIPLVFGQRFIQVVPLVVAMSPISFFLGMIAILRSYLTSKSYPNEVVYIWVCGLVITIILDLILISKFSVQGAAVSSSVTYIILFIAFLILARRYSRNEQKIVQPGMFPESLRP
jgi:O-antigen/teichoic acid export membrane protein